MKLLLDERDAGLSFETFMLHLKNDCLPVPARVNWRGACRECEAFVSHRFGFWFTVKRTASRHWLQFGLGDPAASSGLVPVCELSFPFSGFDRRMNAFFVRFGQDVLVAYSGRPTDDVTELRQFLSLHDYDFTGHDVDAPGGKPLKALILASVSNPSPSFGVFRFVSAMNDFRQWTAQGLVSASRPRAVYSFQTSRHAQGCAESPGEELETLVENGVRELLARQIEARKLRLKIAGAPGGCTVLVSPDNTVQAAFVTLTSLAPDRLYEGIGRLLLSRATLRAAKFLVVPGSLGPYFTQALFRHDIQATPYKLTQDMAVVLDTETVFPAIHSPVL